HAHAECGQRNHRRCAHTYEHHLPEDRRDFEKLAGKRRNQNPIKQAEIKLYVIFQGPAASVVADAQDDKARGSKKAESLAGGGGRPTRGEDGPAVCRYRIICRLTRRSSAIVGESELS